MQPFPHDSILTTLAEVSITVVGFSLLASVFRGADDRLRFTGFRNVAEIGLIAAFGSLTPQLLHTFGLTEATSWRFGTGLFGLLLLFGFLFAMQRGRTIAPPKSAGLIIAAFMCVPVVFGLAVANVFFPSEISGGRHVLAIVMTLAIASLIFMNVAFDMELKPPADN